MATTWRGFSYDLVANDLDGLSQYATQDAGLAVRGSLLCGCSPWPQAYSGASFSAPPQKTYPASFLAEFSGLNYRQKTFYRDVIFTQTSAGSPWLVASAGTYTAPHPLLAPTSKASTAPGSAPLLGTAPAKFAQFFEQLDSTGTTTNPVPTGFATTSFLTALVNGSTRSYDTDKSEGVRRTVSHQVVKVTPRFAVPASPGTATGATYECFFMDFATTYAAPSGKVLQQTVNSVVWTTLLAPGSYSSIREVEEKDVCIVEPSSGTGVDLSSTRGGPTEVSGDPGRGTPVTATSN